VITRNPYNRAAAVCCLLGAIASFAGNSVLALPFLAVGFVIAVIGYGRRGEYPR
jgi:hypothetical protein